MGVGRYRHPVTLERSPQLSPDVDGYWEALSPADWWVAIEPLPPGEDGRTIRHLVTGRYRSDVTVDTRILVGTRALYVKGVQHVEERGAELRLYCEEVVA